MWHWPQVSGSRASSTEAACRAWQAVQVPIEPSLFGLPTSWHFRQPLFTAAGPSSRRSPCGLRSTAPLWNCSEKATCSAVKSSLPATDAHAGAAWRLRRNCSYSVWWHCLQLAAVTFLAMMKPAVVHRLLPLDGPVAVQAVDPGRVVPAHLELVDDRRGLLAVALGALAGRPDQRRGRLRDLRRAAASR